MKKTVSAAASELRAFLKNSVLFSDAKKPNGILAYDRLDNSDKEDVIIEPLPINVRQVQEGVININIFVPNLLLKFGEKNDRSQRDASRLAYLEALVFQSFESDDVFGFDYNFNLQQSNIIEDGSEWYYLNFRIEYTAVNL